jgi:hypothetical protein
MYFLAMVGSAANVFCKSQFVSIKAQGDKEDEYQGFTYKPGYQALKDQDEEAFFA